MKYQSALLFLLLPVFVWTQNTDYTSIYLVDSLVKTARALNAKKEFDKALELNVTAEKIALEKLGMESAGYGSCCFNHGRILYFKKNYPEAEKWYLAAKAIREKVLSSDHPDYASSLFNLAILYQSMDQFNKAEPLYIKAKAIREKALGKEHPDYGYCVYNMAELYKKMGQYEKAELFYLEIKALDEKKTGKEHPDYITDLTNLAMLYQEMAQFDKSEMFRLEAKTILEKISGKENQDYLINLGNLANLYWIMGQYEKVEPLYNEYLGLAENVFGKEHSEYAKTLNNLAALYFNLGQYQKAETYYLDAKVIREKVLGKEHPDYAASLNNLAVLYRRQGQEAKALPLQLEATAIDEKAFGKEHSEYASDLLNLASVYLSMNQYDKAEALYLEAKNIRLKIFGKEHPDYAACLNNLGILYFELGKYDKAEVYYLEAMAIRKKILGVQHPDYLECLNNLATLYKRKGQWEAASSFFLDLATANRHALEKTLQFLSDRELNNYLNLFTQDQSQILSFTQINPGKQTISTCFDNALFYKGFLLNASNHLKRLANSNPVTADKFKQLNFYRQKLAEQYSLAYIQQDSSKIKELEEKSNTLEKDLSRTNAGYGEALHQVNWQDVQLKLKNDEAAIEFVNYKYYGKNETDSTMYAALVLRPGINIPAFISLFEERSLDSLFSYQSERKADYANHLYTIPDRGAQIIENPKKTLYELIWKNLEMELKGVHTIYYSPSGLLHRLNLGAIPVNAEEYLTDRYRLIELSSTRQLAIPNDVQYKGKEVVLYGGLIYELNSISLPKEELLANHSRSELSFEFTDSTLRGGNWNYLDGTNKEIKSIQTIVNSSGLQAVLKTNNEGTEESFKELGAVKESPIVLHVATHGYFFPDLKQKGKTHLSGKESVFKISDHPMLRSGLILSGGNAGWKGDRSFSSREDGILTAYEISQMNLSNTELIVLSACETGLGDIQGNEGVYGLQRAFKIAGVKYIIMSLWQVPDKQTSLLMTTFYKNWLNQKLAIPDAFHAAQKELRDIGLDPYQWAGFVLIE